jgi:hypothetical protein
MAFYSLEPWGVNANNWQAATIGASICNSMGAKPARKAEGFMPDSVKEKKKAPPWQVLRDRVSAIAKGWKKPRDA